MLPGWQIAENRRGWTRVRRGELVCDVRSIKGYMKIVAITTQRNGRRNRIIDIAVVCRFINGYAITTREQCEGKTGRRKRYTLAKRYSKSAHPQTRRCNRLGS